MSKTKIAIFPKIKSLSAALVLLLLFGCPQNLAPNNYPVKRVSDGDTLVASDSAGKDIKVRFACIDAPEVAHTNAEKNSKASAKKNQFKWGNLAHQRMQQLVKQGGGRVVLTVTDTDRYGRKVSEVRLPNGTFAQEVLTREGLAMVYRPYLKTVRVQVFWNKPKPKLRKIAAAFGVILSLFQRGNFGRVINDGKKEVRQRIV
jgi:micrococcal nuclease